MNSPSGAQHQQGQEPKMLLGKRPRPPPPTKSMRRTTSMGGIVATVEPDIIDEEPVHPPQHGIKDPPHDKAVAPPISTTVTAAAGFQNEERFVMSPSSSSTIASSNVNSPHVTPTPHFLRTCGLCKRSLAPGRDIYMYRGDTAFCSLECREKQMRQDERKDQKLKVQASNKQVRSPSPPPPSEDPTNTKSVVAAST